MVIHLFLFIFVNLYPRILIPIDFWSVERGVGERETSMCNRCIGDRILNLGACP